MTARGLTIIAGIMLLGAAADPLGSIATILADRPDGAAVDITGVVAVTQPATSEAGSDYEVLGLCQNACITVFFPNHVRLNDGDAARVRGTFHREVRAGTRTFMNEIVATSVERVAFPHESARNAK
jgi:hypothetical protein